MKNSSYGYYGGTAAASSLDDDRLGFGLGGSLHTLSRGAQLEAAVEKLPGWYFETADEREERERDGDRWLGSSRSRRSQLYLDDSLELLGSVSEANDNDDDDDDAENNQNTANVSAGMPRARSIRSSYLLGSPDRKIDAPMSNSTAASSVVVLDEPVAVAVNSASNQQDQQKRATDTSPLSQKETRSSRQHRLSSRRSTISSSCACTDLVVTRYTMGGRDKKVMYHIDVVNQENQLQTYTIRRSYTDFKVLHSDLSAMLEARKEYYTSKSQLQHSVLESKERRSLNTTGAPGHSSSNSFQSNNNSTNAAATGNSRLRTQFSSPEDALEASVMAFTLPTLPHAGLMSFWRRHDHSHLKNRCDIFQEILRAILKMPFLRESFAMQKFLSTAPCAIRERGSSYVSLCEYSVPQLDLDEEHRERRRRAQEHRRNSSVTSASMSVYEY